MNSSFHSLNVRVLMAVLPNPQETLIKEIPSNQVTQLDLTDLEEDVHRYFENGLAETRRRSLVPRLPRSGMRTLKLCRRGEPGIFCHVKSAKDRREVDATIIVRGRMRLRTEKGTKVADNLLHISSYRGLNNIHTER